MGLLDGVLGNVLGSVMGGGQQQQANPMLNIVLGMLANGGQQQQGGGAGGGMGGGMGGVLGGALSSMGGMGGLGGLLQQFQGAGLGHVADSWVGKGDNLPISGDQLQNVLGSDMIGNIAQQLGMSHGDTAGQLSQMLPDIISHLTPHGEAPAGGLGSADDIMGMLGGLLKK